MPAPHEELACRGPSMRPLLASGDRIRYVRASADEVALGDVVVLLWTSAYGPEMLIHRLIWKSRRGGAWRLRTKGDANPRPDPDAPEGALIGKVVAIKKGERPWRRVDGVRGRLAHLWTGLAASAAVGARFYAHRGVVELYNRLSRRPAPCLRGARRALAEAMLDLESRLPRDKSLVGEER